jgi:drug/metabolite transporter (DMT)-like permease
VVVELEEQGLSLGIVLALACAAVTQLSFLCKHRGAAAAPAVELARPLASAKALFKSRWFAVGMAVAAVAYVLHVAALALAPLSVVQVSLASGVVMLAVLGDRVFGCRVGRRQWLGACLTAAGLVLLVVTLPRADGSSTIAVPAVLAFEAGMLALGALLLIAPRLGAPAQHHGVVLGAAAGVLFGVSDIAVKALAENGFASPWLPVAALASVMAFLASARAFQQADAVPVIATTSTAANITVILGGLTVFGDALAGGLMLAVQLLAFALVAASAIITPARAA